MKGVLTMDPDLVYCYQCEFFEHCEGVFDESTACGEFIAVGTLKESEVESDEDF